MDPPPPPVDLLSSFPEHLQEEILRRLDLRDAVRTSALSRAWRRRWETVPGLALSFPRGTPPSVVDRVLLRYAAPSVSRFVCYVGADEASASHVDDWLIALSRRSVESITIHGTIAVHSSIFSCDRLVSLTLHWCSIPPFPQPGGFTGFPMLNELWLKDVKFVDNGLSQLQAIIRASPMLGVLVLDMVFYAYDMDVVIEAPNLHTLKLVHTPMIFETPNLQYACINLPYQLGSKPVALVELLAGVSQVQELIFYGSRDLKMEAIPFTFSNLKSMDLFTDFAEMSSILLMFCLLRSSPNLEKLKLQLGRPKVVGNQKFLNAQWTNGMCAKLQAVEIISGGGRLPLSFMKLILSKASLLRTLSVDACPISQNDRLNGLLNCRRASPQAQVLFKVPLEGIRFNHKKYAEKRLD